MAFHAERVLQTYFSATSDLPTSEGPFHQHCERPKCHGHRFAPNFEVDRGSSDAGDQT
jgi:hypothetical protein